MISDNGKVLSRERRGTDGRLLKKKEIKGGHYTNGYQFVCLRKNGNSKKFSVHRLVAEAFIPNPQNLPCVNHIDGNKQNNSVENLEWCTYSENLKHAIDIGLVESQCKIRRSVIISKNNKEIYFKSMKECADFFWFQKMLDS